MSKNPIYSKSGNFLIVVDFECKDYYAARIFSKVRSYWEPVIAETNMSTKRFEEFVNG